MLLVGWGALKPGQYGDDIFVADSVPHDYLFERVSAVVHAGGAGTSAASLRAGVPSVIIPGFADQFFWAKRLADLGVAAPPLKWRSLETDDLSESIATAVTSPRMRQAAQAARDRVRGEDGVGKAVATIERYVAAA